MAESITQRLIRATSRTDAHRLHTRRPIAEAVIIAEACCANSIVCLIQNML
jgi:hypothetical protein